MKDGLKSDLSTGKAFLILLSFRPGIDDDNPVIDRFKPINLHLEMDKFEPDLMLPDPNDPSLYISIRMIPPGV